MSASGLLPISEVKCVCPINRTGTVTVNASDSQELTTPEALDSGTINITFQASDGLLGSGIRRQVPMRQNPETCSPPNNIWH